MAVLYANMWKTEVLIFFLIVHETTIPFAALRSCEIQTSFANNEPQLRSSGPKLAMQKEQNDFSEHSTFDFLASGPALCAVFSSCLGGCYMLIR